MKPKRLLLFLVCLGLGATFMPGCEPPAPPDGENPPCLSDFTPKQQTVLSRENASFQITFSKEINKETVSENTIFLVRGEMDDGFLANLESASAVTTTRRTQLTPLAITVDPGDPKKYNIKPTITLRGDEVYSLILTRRIRDALIDLGEFKFSGGRPLNLCADAQTKVWTGSLDQYRSGFSVVLEYRTEAEPPRPGTPRITEIMASPPTGFAEYIEIQNTHASESLNLCGLSLSDGGTGREIIGFGGNCPQIGPGKLAVVIEPDYDIRGNPYKIPSGVAILTVSDSTTTLFPSGLSGGEPVQLLNGEDLLEQISPGSVAGGVWPSGGKSFEKCDPNGSGTDPSNWAEGGVGGSPGKTNTAQCP